MFTDEEIVSIKRIWALAFPEKDNFRRDNLIYFNLTTNALFNGDARPLLKHYGGEQVYMPLQRESSIAQKLQGIGTPLLIKAILDPKQLSNFYKGDIAKIAISSFHRHLRRDATQCDRDAYQREPVLPNQIEIIDLSNLNGNKEQQEFF